jgi:RimJ/RimL family protein N-acetyltransferase
MPDCCRCTNGLMTARLQDAKTDRLSLCRLTDRDLTELVELFADPNVWRFEYERGLTKSETEAFLERQLAMWDGHAFGGCAVRRLEDGTLIGVAGLGVATVQHARLPSITVGWRFASRAWGRGYATEAATALLQQAFGSMGFDAVGCVTSAENDRSIAVARRLGMEAVAREAVPRDDGSGNVTALLLRIDRWRWIGRSLDRLPTT